MKTIARFFSIAVTLFAATALHTGCSSQRPYVRNLELMNTVKRVAIIQVAGREKMEGAREWAMDDQYSYLEEKLQDYFQRYGYVVASPKKISLKEFDAAFLSVYDPEEAKQYISTERLTEKDLEQLEIEQDKGELRGLSSKTFIPTPTTERFTDYFSPGYTKKTGMRYSKSYARAMGVLAKKLKVDGVIVVTTKMRSRTESRPTSMTGILVDKAKKSPVMVNVKLFVAMFHSTGEEFYRYHGTAETSGFGMNVGGASVSLDDDRQTQAVQFSTLSAVYGIEGVEPR